MIMVWQVEKLRDYLTSLHVATDSEELFVLVLGDNLLRHYFICFLFILEISFYLYFRFQVLKGVDDAIQKVSCFERFETICENYRQWISISFQQHQTAPKLNCSSR